MLFVLLAFINTVFTLEKKKKLYTVPLESIHPPLQPQISLKHQQTWNFLGVLGGRKPPHTLKQVAQTRHYKDQAKLSAWARKTTGREKVSKSAATTLMGLQSSQTEIGEPVHSSTISTLWESSQKEATSEDFIVWDKKLSHLV